jgi:hypothetical protein
MNKTSIALASLVIAGTAWGPQALAASSASSAASDSVGASSNGISGSLTTSSNSSTTKNVAQGDYRIIDVVTADARPDHLRLTLQRERPAGQQASAHDTLHLTLPLRAFDASGLTRGERVAATQRSYGIEFARSDNKAPFFLVLEDHWLQELASRPVVL